MYTIFAYFCDHLTDNYLTFQIGYFRFNVIGYREIKLI